MFLNVNTKVIVVIEYVVYIAESKTCSVRSVDEKNVSLEKKINLNILDFD